MRTLIRTMCWASAAAALAGAATFGPVLAQGRGGGPGGGGGGPKPPRVDHTTRQVRPIALGVSGGNATDIANGFCCSGTLGALLQNQSGRQFILSNSHVFAHDTSGPDVAEIGDPINQAGLIDTQCVAADDDTVASLSSLSSINPGGVSGVDAAIAEVQPGQVDSAGSILEIGTISAAPLGPALGLRVKKSGRTTGLTKSRIEGLNAMIQVGYSTECGGDSFTSSYANQIIIANRGSKFIKGGDSGSLMVEDVETSPRAVGLLFAGSSSIAIANPIDVVLDHFGLSLVGAPGGGASIVPDAPGQQETARAVAAQNRNAARLFSVPGAIGHAVGINGAGVAIKVYVEEMSDRARQGAPPQLDGVPVIVEAVGRVMAIGSMAGACVAR